MAENEGLRTTGEAIVVSLTPDICKTPPSMIPVPYQIIGKFSDGVSYANKVCMTALNTMTMDSRLTTVYGDEAGVGGGIVSGVNKGYCRPITHSSSVRAEGYHITFHTSLYWMNCAGPDGPGNTTGYVTYVENVSTVYIGPLGAIEGNTNPALRPETAAEDFQRKLNESLRKIREKWAERLDKEILLVLILKELSNYERHLPAMRGDVGLRLLNSLRETIQYGGDVASLVDPSSWLRDLNPELRAKLDADGGLFKYPSPLRALQQTGESIVGFGNLVYWGSELSGMGEFGDKMRQDGFQIPDWFPSKQRGEDKIYNLLSETLIPRLKPLEDGHYGEFVASARAETEGLAAQGAIEFFGEKWLSFAKISKYMDELAGLGRASQRFDGGIIISKADFLKKPTIEMQKLLDELAELAEPADDVPGTNAHAMRIVSEKLGNEAAKQYLRAKLGRNIPDGDFLEFNGKNTVNLYYKDPVTGKVYILEAKGGMYKPKMGTRVDASGIEVTQGTKPYLRDIATAMSNSDAPLKPAAGNEILDAISKGNYEYIGVWGKYEKRSNAAFPPQEIFSVSP